MKAMNDVTGSVARSVDQASNNVHRAIDKATDVARPAVDTIASSAHQAVDKIANVATHAAETLDIKSEQMRDAQQRFTESCRVYVRDKPFTTLGIAVASGFLLSWIMRSR